MTPRSTSIPVDASVATNVAGDSILQPAWKYLGAVLMKAIRRLLEPVWIELLVSLSRSWLGVRNDLLAFEKNRASGSSFSIEHSYTQC